MTDKLAQKTINDFGDQWSQFPDNEGYHASYKLFADLLQPLIAVDDLKGMTVAEVGSGTGRIVNMLLDAGADRVYALEPSVAGFQALKENTKQRSDRIIYLNELCTDLAPDLQLDYVFSIGVIQFIPAPESTIAACFRALKPGGKCFIWVYGTEGNEAYLRFVTPLRRITTAVPNWLLAWLCHPLNLLLDIYIGLCRYIPLPMREYMRNHLAKLNRRKRYLTIYDQLNPAYAKYYSEPEAREILARAGFADVCTYHRLGYSWTVLGTRPK